MTRTQVQLPDPLYERAKEVAKMNDWSLAEVLRRATEIYVQRFPKYEETHTTWSFPTIDSQGDYLVDPADIHSELDAITHRSGV